MTKKYEIATDTSEKWKPVVGFEGIYEVSDLGRVRSVSRWISYVNARGFTVTKSRPGQIIALAPHTGGYLMVHLYRDGKRTAMLLHRAVAEAFIGPRPEGYQICHGDGDKQNCRLSNLRYGTKAENEADKDHHGTRMRGEKHATAKLSEADVLAIRNRIGEPQHLLAEEFGCTFSNISAIQLRKSWRHV